MAISSRLWMGIDGMGRAGDNARPSLIGSLDTGRAVELLVEAVPAVDIIVLQRGGPGCPFGHVLREAGLEHETHGLGQLFRLQLRIRGAFEGVSVGAVW